MAISPESIRPVLHVSDLNASLAFYTGVLGCTEEFLFEDRYAGVALGDVHLHLSQGVGLYNKPVGGANIYLLLNTASEVDDCYRQIVSLGGRVGPEPHDYPYGMRDFVAFDPDGNQLSFGADIQA